jgi:hypothetical protein
MPVAPVIGTKGRGVAAAGIGGAVEAGVSNLISNTSTAPENCGDSMRTSS